MKAPEAQFLEVNGIRTAHLIAYPPQGDGAAVLALHGWGGHSGLMIPVAERLAPLGYRVFAPDLPGFGQSALPPATWGVSDYVAFVVAYMDANELDQVFLIGHSFGGRLGLVLGAEHTSRIRKMALVDSAGVSPRRSFASRARLSLYKSIRDALYKIGAKSSANRLGAWYGQHYGSADYQSAGALRETFVRVVNEDLLPYAARVACPTLLFWGEKDEDTPLWQGQLLEKTIPDAGLIVYSGAGHYSYLEHLSEFVYVIDHFFEQKS
jgi:pimeloyl-ACP methyl ester carboxylesterase